MGYPTYGQGYLAEPDRATADAQQQLVEISQWIDRPNQDQEQLTQLVFRTSVKLAEETGEVGEALIGYLGQNPRKGVTHTIEDVQEELLDVAITALGAYEHIVGHQGNAIAALFAKIDAVHRRMK